MSSIDPHQTAGRHQDPEFIRATFASIARRYDFANHALSLGADFTWRNVAARLVQSWRPTRILDLATGSGDLALVLRSCCPDAKVIGADFCQPMLLQAIAKGMTPLVNGDGTSLPFADSAFDVTTVAFGLRNMASREGALREMARVIKPGGHVLILDFSLPSNPLLREPYRLYLHHILPTIAGMVTRQRAAYDYLGDSIEAFPRGQAMLDLLEKSGFEAADCRPLWLGIVALYSARRSSDALLSTAGIGRPTGTTGA